MKLIKEFKEFAMRGNVVDLAVGVIIGAAFGKVITSLVNDIIMPPLGKILGGINFADLFISLEPSKTAGLSLAQAKQAGATVIAYGSFVNTIVDFIIVAFCIFMLIKGINSFKKNPPADATMKECPRCLNTVPIKATRCGHCTSDI
jgi:large conductance mechanosensitive channel